MRAPLHCLWLASLSWLFSTCWAEEPFAAARIVLEQRCVSCHHGDEPKGGLDLSRKDGAERGGQSGPAIVAGDAAASLIIQYVSGSEPFMPKDGPPLGPDEIRALEAWIAAGAPWPDDAVLADRRWEQPWWSLSPLAEVAPPDLHDPWVRNPIDAFVLAKLREHDLGPSPEADRRTLIRRLTFDLHGLPPTPEEVAAYETDASPDAYERLVDRLLASPRYGERWARHWLDVVHYGESHGYDKDKPRTHAWPYRDYVIAALNADMPYSQFVREQLAGDVLGEHPRGVAATGFISAGPWDFVGHVELREGTVDKLITRALDRDDMVMTTISTFLSLTAHCARCHDHKFDPIRMEDYYRLQAVFAGVERADQPMFADEPTYRRWQALQGELASLSARLKSAQQAAEERAPAVSELDAQVSALQRRLELMPAPDAEQSRTNGYHGAILPAADTVQWVQVDLGQSLPLERVRLVPARPVDFPDTPGFGFPLRFRIEVSDEPEFAQPWLLADRSAEDFVNPLDVPVEFDAGGRPGRYVRLVATRLWKRLDDYVLALSELEVYSGGRNVALGGDVTALHSIEAGLWGAAWLVDGYSSRVRLADEAALAALAARRERLVQELARLKAERQARLLELVPPELRGELQRLPAAIEQVQAQLEALPPPQYVYAVQSIPPRPIHLLRRGSVKEPGPEMAPGGLACLPGMTGELELSDAGDSRARRAAFAQWLTDPRNVLLRRSIVNRVWHYHFGRGLVDTPNDFGRMGSLPTHPELLDWLAGEFQRQGESLKWLHRLIVCSSTYRQVSRDHEAGLAADAGNRFLWRANRQRLDAESLRDAVLAVSGKLDLRMGGPSDQQYWFKDDHSPVYDYERFDVESPLAFRRSVYRFIVRSVPDPFMECLDAPDPSLLAPKRNATLTALQSLTLLNNRFMLSQSRHFAERLAALAPSVQEQIEWAYRLALARRPDAVELTLLTDYARRHGLANACRLILNSNEFAFVD